MRQLIITNKWTPVQQLLFLPFCLLDLDFISDGTFLLLNRKDVQKAR